MSTVVCHLARAYALPCVPAGRNHANKLYWLAGPELDLSDVTLYNDPLQARCRAGMCR